MTSFPLLKVEGLTKIFTPSQRWLSWSSLSPFTAVNHISFELQPGEILGLLGPNGAGKTTTIQMLLGILTPTEGSIHYFGKNLASHRSEILQHITHASAYTKLPGSLTIGENLEIYARLYGVAENERNRRIDELLTAFGIQDLRYRYANSLSAGQMTRVILAKAFLSRPKVVLLDEPTASLDPDIAKETRRFILEQQQKYQVSMILTSHNMSEVAEVCDRILVLQKGTIIEEDEPEKLAKSVALSRLQLIIPDGMDKVVKLLEHQTMRYQITDSLLTVELDEKDIAAFLTTLARHQVLYTHIDILKPSLEDYFLHISKKVD
jgi:ABC-2 type transport system ATP-binding protein